MTAFFFDSSALSKRFVNETGSAWVNAVTQVSEGHQIHIAAITGVEVVAALARRGRGGTLTPATLAAVLRQFAHEYTNLYQIVDVTPALIASAMNLAESYALRGYDPVQLAAALTLNAERLALGLSALTLVSADVELNAAARADGLMVEDPNTHL